jgi:hypothetical protein
VNEAETIKKSNAFIKSHKWFIGLVALIPIVLSSCASSNVQCQNGDSVIAGGAPMHVTILLDDSSSMYDLAEEVVTSFNTLLSDLPDSATLSLYGFGDESGIRVLIENESVSSVEPLDLFQYAPDGQTPLYDAISFALTRTDSIITQANLKNSLFVIISDGWENASVRYSLNETQSIVQTAISEGTIIRFIALGEDAATEAANLGIDVSSTESFNPNADGVSDAFDNIGGSFNQQTSNPKCDQLIPRG